MYRMPYRCEEMLTKVNIGIPMKQDDRSHAAPKRHHRASLVGKMNYCDMRQVIDPPTGITDALTVIGINMIEEPLIQISDCLDQFSTDHHGGPRDIAGRKWSGHILTQMQQMATRPWIGRA